MEEASRLVRLGRLQSLRLPLELTTKAGTIDLISAPLVVAPCETQEQGSVEKDSRKFDSPLPASGARLKLDPRKPADRTEEAEIGKHAANIDVPLEKASIAM